MNKKTESDRGVSYLTLHDVLNRYIEESPSANTQALKSAVFRFLVPGLGGVAPIGKRMTAKEITAAIEVLSEVPVDKLREAVRIQKEEMDRRQVNQNAQKTHRCHLNRWINWCREQGILSDHSQEGESEEKPYRMRPGTALHVEFRKYVYRSEKYALVESETSDKLASELRDFEEFSKGKLNRRNISVEMDVTNIRRLMGWLHRYRKVSFEDLSLSLLVPFIKLRHFSRDFETYVDYAVSKARSEEECFEKAQDTVALLEDFFRFRKGSPRTNQKVVEVVVNIAKFVYRQEVSRKQGYESIPFIQELNYLANELGKEARQKGCVVPKETRMVDWEKALEILEKLRFEADLEILKSWDSKRLKYGKKRRPAIAVAQSLQRFLILGFFVLMPPDRQRTIRELQVGCTFVKGSRDSGIFVPVEQMRDKDAAQWWIHLHPDDYKTGKSYGEQWHPVPNVEFFDGKKFYDYIDRWINEGRELLNPCGETLFLQLKTGRPMGSQHLRSIVQHTFKRFTGVPVTPHRMRDMYVTYLKRIGASEAELEAAAMAMHHSREMQSKVYNQQTKDEKIAPIYDRHAQILEKVLKKK